MTIILYLSHCLNSRRKEYNIFVAQTVANENIRVAMKYDKKLSFVTAERLKKLREGKGLSHAALSKAIKEKSSEDISRDSLINYECQDEHSTSKVYKNHGMSTKNLLCLAAFYGVSTDYILGVSDVKSPKNGIGDAVNITGLSEENILTLSLAHQASEIATPFNPLLMNPEQRSLFLEWAHSSGLLQSITGTTGANKQDVWREYSMGSNLYDEVIVGHLSYLGKFVNDIVSCATSTPSVVNAYRFFLDAIPSLFMGSGLEPPKIGDSAEAIRMMRKGYAFTPPEQYLQLQTMLISKGITDYLNDTHIQDKDNK